MNRNFGIIILAAGSSSRLGRPKQLLQFDGKTLLQSSIEVAAAAGTSSVVVVVGSNAALLQKDIVKTGVHVVLNEQWAAGMATSVTCGLKALLAENAGIEGVVVMVCDQPYVSSLLINELIIVHIKTGKPIVTCSYANTYGPPTLFHKNLFPELLELKGDVGAKGIIKKYTDEVEIIAFPDGVTDIDTEADYQQLVQHT